MATPFEEGTTDKLDLGIYPEASYLLEIPVHPESLREDLRYVMSRLNHAAEGERAIFARLKTISDAALTAMPIPMALSEEVKQSYDHVNHPAHYNQYRGLEIIDLVEQMNFNRGNAVKYIARAGFKAPEKTVEDLEKARWYIDREIARLRKEEK